MMPRLMGHRDDSRWWERAIDAIAADREHPLVVLLMLVVMAIAVLYVGAHVVSWWLR